jgi:hypothetical protein
MRTNRSSSQRFFYQRIASALSSALGASPTAALLVGCAAVLVSSRSSELNAQKVDFRPQAGLSLPSRISIQNGVLHLRQKIGVTVGARLTLSFNQRFDVATGITYLPGYAIFRGAGKRIDLGTSSHLLTASSGARYWLLPSTGMLSWEVHTGFGVVLGGQRAYEDLFQSSTVSGILGTTVRYQIGRMMSVQLRVRDRLYRVRLGHGDSGSSSSPLHISFGVGLPFQEAAP